MKTSYSVVQINLVNQRPAWAHVWCQGSIQQRLVVIYSFTFTIGKEETPNESDTEEQVEETMETDSPAPQETENQPDQT